MSTKKQIKTIKKPKDNSKVKELVFTEKEKDCTNCPKEQEITLELGLTINDEWEKVIPMTLQYRHSPEEIKYIYNFYNRVFKENKQPGCGKCFVNVCKFLRQRWAEMNK